MRRVLLAVGLVLWLSPLLLPAVAAPAAEPATLRDRIARDLGAQGLDWRDVVTDPMPVHVVDLATGEGALVLRDRDAFLAEFEAGMALAPPAGGASVDGAPHNVAGDVYHFCYDFVRHCYKFYTNAAGKDVRTLRNDAQPAYAAARAPYDGLPTSGTVRFPVHGANALYVQGVYSLGGHRASNPLAVTSASGGVGVEDGLPGSGQMHGDRSMFGGGAGFLSYYISCWNGPDMCITLGNIRAHGAWRFCDTETAPECRAP